MGCDSNVLNVKATTGAPKSKATTGAARSRTSSNARETTAMNTKSPTQKVETTAKVQRYTICGKNGCTGLSVADCPTTYITVNGTTTMCDTYKDLGCAKMADVPCKAGTVSHTKCCIDSDSCLNVCEDGTSSAANRVYTFAAALMLLLCMF